MLKPNQFKFKLQAMSKQKNGVSSQKIIQDHAQKIRMLERLEDFMEFCKSDRVRCELPELVKVGSDPRAYPVFWNGKYWTNSNGERKKQHSVFGDLEPKLDDWQKNK